MHGPLTLRGLAALVVGLLAIALGITLGSSSIVGFGVLVLVLIMAGFVILSVASSRVTAERPLSRMMVEAKTETLIELTLARRARGATGLQWADDLPEGLASDQSARGYTVVNRNNPMSISYRVTAQRRGRYTIGPVTMRMTDVFGLTQLTRRAGGQISLIATPPLVQVPALNQHANLAGSLVSQRGSLLERQSTDVIPRPFHSGDSKRRIHWRATAKVGEPMVRQEEHEARAETLLILDRRAFQHSAPAFELAVSVCASIAAQLARSGTPVEVRDDRGQSLGNTVRRHLSDLLVTLATITRHDEVSRITDAVPHSERRTVIFVTDSDLDDDDARAVARNGWSLVCPRDLQHSLPHGANA